MTRVIPTTVVEMPEFKTRAAKLLEPDEVLELVTEIAKDPLTGDVIAGTGGVRKLRFAVSGRGKRGGCRVIYVYYGETLPVFVLTCYPKNVKDNLTPADKKELKRLVPVLKSAYEAGIATRILREKDRRNEVEPNGDEGKEEGRARA